MDIGDASWVRLASSGDVPDESALHVEYANLPVCLARSRGRLYAIVDQCSHQDVPLSEGDVEDGTIECYMHGSRFDLETGRALGPPAIKDVAVLPLEVEGDDVYVALPPCVGE